MALSWYCWYCYFSRRNFFVPATDLQDALEMESGYIKNEQVTAASAKQGFDAWKGRLNGESCWIPGRVSSTEYISVTFSSAKTIKAIATQGAPKQDCWVTTYKVEWQYGDSSSVFRKVNVLIAEHQL